MTTVLTNGLFDILVDVIPSMIVMVSAAAKKVKKSNKDKKAEFKRARQYDESDISENLQKEIKRMSRNSSIMEVAFTSVAIKSNDLVKYTMYYLTTDSAKKINLKNHECRFVNAICVLAGFAPIYPELGIADLSKYDAKSSDFNFDEYFLIDIDDIRSKVINIDFQEKVKGKLARKSIFDMSVPTLTGHTIDTGVNARIDESGLIHPIFFSSSSPKPANKYYDSMDMDVYNRFESAFGAILSNMGVEYHYSFDQAGNHLLQIVRDSAMGAVDTYIIDDGRIMGGTKVHILADYINQNGTKDTIFVDSKHQDIVAQVLQNRFFTLTPDMVVTCMHDMFNNGLIYHYIDFSNTKWMDSLTAEQREALEKNLSACISNLNMDIRMRFDSIMDVNNFILTSGGTISTLPGITAPNSNMTVNLVMNNGNISWS